MKRITARHITVGDYVKFNGKVEVICGINAWDNTMQISCEPDGEIWFKNGIKSVRPIIITEDWLILNGFKKCNSSNLYYNNKLNIQYQFTDKSFSKDEFNAPNIIYIHQMQQAYRVATDGKQLNFKF